MQLKAGSQWTGKSFAGEENEKIIWNPHPTLHFLFGKLGFLRITNIFKASDFHPDS